MERREIEETGGMGKIMSDTPALSQQGGWHQDPQEKGSLNKQDGALLLSRAPRRRGWKEILGNLGVKV